MKYSGRKNRQRLYLYTYIIYILYTLLWWFHLGSAYLHINQQDHLPVYAHRNMDACQNQWPIYITIFFSRKTLSSAIYFYLKNKNKKKTHQTYVQWKNSPNTSEEARGFRCCVSRFRLLKLMPFWRCECMFSLKIQDIFYRAFGFASAEMSSRCADTDACHPVIFVRFEELSQRNGWLRGSPVSSPEVYIFFFWFVSSIGTDSHEDSWTNSNSNTFIVSSPTVRAKHRSKRLQAITEAFDYFLTVLRLQNVITKIFFHIGIGWCQFVHVSNWL